MSKSQPILQVLDLARYNAAAWPQVQNENPLSHSASAITSQQNGNINAKAVG
jgi:hypothetical protein